MATRTHFKGMFPPRPMTDQELSDLSNAVSHGDEEPETMTEDGYLWHFGMLKASDTREFEGIARDDTSGGTSTATYHRVNGELVRVRKQTGVWFVADTWSRGHWSGIDWVRGEVYQRYGSPNKETVEALYEAVLARISGQGAPAPF